MEKTKKNDFIELDFTAKVKDSGMIFDTTIEKDAKEANLPVKNLKPMEICIGQDMVVKGFDKEIENKEVGKKYSADVSPKESFGERNPRLIKTVPMKIFIEKQINPTRGLMLSMDGMIARIASVSGGRVMVDFNNPLAGKIVTYNFEIRKKIEDMKEKIRVLTKFFVGENPHVELENGKTIVELKSKRNYDVLKKKAKEILGIEIEVKEKKEKEEKTEEKAKEEKNEQKEL